MATSVPLNKIVSMLSDDSVEKRISAAVVLGELKAKGDGVHEGLVLMLDSDTPALQRPALEALARIGAKKALSSIFPLLSVRNADVVAAATRAIASLGESVVPKISARMEEAGTEERRALDAVLAELGGKDAFSTLLDALMFEDADAAKRAALQVRHHIKDASRAERKSHRSQVEKFLKKKELATLTHAKAAAVKILGYLEDDTAIPTLIAYADADGEPWQVRHEALIALRFALQAGKRVDDVMNVLINVAGAQDRQLSRTAIDTLRMLEIPEKHIAKFAKLADHEDLARAQAAIAKLGEQGGAKASKALVTVVTSGGQRSAEAAAEALDGNEEAVVDLAKALVAATNSFRGGLMAKVLKPMTSKIKPATKKQIIDAAIKKLGDGDDSWEPTLSIARDLDAKKTAEGLRALAAKLRKSKKKDKEIAVLTLLCKHEGAEDDDRFRLATAELLQSRKDTQPHARARDPALKRLGELLDNGFDVLAAMRKDRNIGNDELFYVGFHFVEDDHPVGEDMLGEVVKKSPRTKLGKAAKNKLKLVQAEA
jgi:HEAT repeat protein